MANRKLTTEQIALADTLLSLVRQELATLSGEDKELLFAYRRRLTVKLIHDERGTPAQRNKLKDLKHAEQGGLCAICRTPLPRKYAELDRFNASAGYTPANTRLVHHDCHITDQAEKNYR